MGWRGTLNFAVFEMNIAMGFPDGTVVKNSPANAGDLRDKISIPRLGRSPEEEMAAHSSILAWRIPWTEDPGGLQSMGLQSWTQLSRHTGEDSGTPLQYSCLETPMDRGAW